MTAPTRTRSSGNRARSTTHAPERRRQPDSPPNTTPAQPSKTTHRGSPRTRSAAAERAYARRAHRVGKSTAREAVAVRSGTASRASFVVLVMSLLVSGVAATLYLSTQAIADSYRLENATQAANSLAERAEILQREVMRKESPAALAKRARELGMVPGGNPARIIVGPNGKAKVVGKPSPASAPKPPPAQPEQPPAQPPPGDQREPGQQPAPGGQPNDAAQRAGHGQPEQGQQRPADQPDSPNQQARAEGER